MRKIYFILSLCFLIVLSSCSTPQDDWKVIEESMKLCTNTLVGLTECGNSFDRCLQRCADRVAGPKCLGDCVVQRKVCDSTLYDQFERQTEYLR